MIHGSSAAIRSLHCWNSMGHLRDTCIQMLNRRQSAQSGVPRHVIVQRMPRLTYLTICRSILDHIIACLHDTNHPSTSTWNISPQQVSTAMFASLAEPLRSLRTWSLSMQVAGFISSLQENAFSTHQFNSSLSPVCMHVPPPK
jgi:hypothetical protein